MGDNKYKFEKVLLIDAFQRNIIQTVAGENKIFS